MDRRPASRVLLVDADHRRVRRIRSALAEGAPPAARLEIARDLGSALDLLSPERFDLALLALDLTGGRAAEAVASLRERAPEVPVVVLVGSDDLAAAGAAVVAGADDYLTPADLDGPVLRRAVRHAIERVDVLGGELRGRSVIDELTGLYNPRGFERVATHHLRLADRTGEPVVLIFVKVRGAGETPADPARLAVETANVLRRVVRESDVVARVRPDAFCVLLTGNAAGTEALVLSRLVEAVADHNARTDRPIPLALSVGAAAYDPADPVELAALIDAADASMRGQPPR